MCLSSENEKNMALIIKLNCAEITHNNSKWRIFIHNLLHNIIYRKIYRNLIYHDKYAGIFWDSFGFICSKLYTLTDCCLKIKQGFSFQKSKRGTGNFLLFQYVTTTILTGLKLITWQKWKPEWWCYVLQIRTS